MLLRLLMWLVLGLAAWWMLRPRAPARPRAASTRPGATAPIEAMVDCARCGLHLPASEALRDAAARPYCCAEHRNAGLQREA